MEKVNILNELYKNIKIKFEKVFNEIREVKYQWIKADYFIEDLSSANINISNILSNLILSEKNILINIYKTKFL